MADSEDTYRRIIEYIAKTQGVAAAAVTLESLEKAEKDAARAAGLVVVNVNKVNSAAKSSASGLSSLRAAQYSVAQTYGTIAAASIAADASVVGAASSFQNSFVSVLRTSDEVKKNGVGAIDDLRESLIDLSTQIPVTFDDLSKIATLGNQMGIAAGDVENFTKVVSEFGTVSGLSAEESASAFGTLANLLGVPTSEFENLGSSIELVGVNSKATDQQIVAVAEQIGRFGPSVGLTSQQVIGLSGAFASVGTPAENARSAVQGLFQSASKAANSGGTALAAYAKLLGTTEDGFKDLLNTDPSKVITALTASLNGLTGTEQDAVLADLKISNSRSIAGLKALSGAKAQEVLTQALKDANTGYSEGTELARQYAIQAQTFSARVQELGNAFLALGSSIGTSALAPLSNLAAGLTSNINLIRDFVESPVGQTVSQWAVGIIAIVGAFTALNAIQALASASTSALATAQIRLQAIQGKQPGLLASLIPGLVTYKTSLDGVTKASYSAAGGLKAFGRATIVLAIIGALVEVIFDFSGSMQSLANTFQAVMPFIRKETQVGGAAIGGVFKFLTQTIANFVSFMGSAATAISQFVPALSGVASQITAIGQGFNDVASRVATAANGIDIGGVVQGWADGFSSWAGSLDDASDSAEDLSYNVTPIVSGLDDTSDSANDASKSLDNTADSADRLSSSLRTSADAATDFSGILSRAFDIQFGPEAALDQITTDLQTMAKNFDTTLKDKVSTTDAITSAWHDMADAIAKAKATLAGLKADKALQEYGLSVDKAFGNTQAVIQDQQALAETNQKIADAQKDASTTLDGNSDAAIDNRAKIQGLVDDYNAYIANLVDSGASTKKIADATKKARTEFGKEASQLGFTEDQYGKYQDTIGKVSTTLTGNSAAALANREAMRGLVTDTNAYATALIAAGDTLPTVKDKITKLTGVIGTHLKAFGNSKNSTKPYTDAISGIGTVIDNLPKNFQVPIPKGANAAKTAVDEFKRSADAARASANKLNSTTVTGPKVSSASKKAARAAKINAEIQFLSAEIDSAAGPNRMRIIDADRVQINRLEAKLSSGKYANGGFTGRGAKYDEAGTVHKGEYVIPKADVNQSTGVPYASALQRLLGQARPSASVSSASSLSMPSSLTVNINPIQLRQLMDSNQVTVALPMGAIAQGVNSANNSSGQKGAY